MNRFLKACIQANEEIKRSLQSGFKDSWFEKTQRGAGGDISSRLDLFAESIFIKHLHTFGTIESEESGLICNKVLDQNGAKIIIDPIDGSSNALSFFPYYGTSVARVNAQGITSDAVVCNLSNGDIFFKTGHHKTQQGTLFSSHFHDPYDVPDAKIGLFEKAYAHPKLVKSLAKAHLKFRAPGAIALSLAYAHTVKYVLYVGNYRSYDFTAGLALCDRFEVIVEEDYVIVSKEKKIAHQLEQLVQSK